MFCLPGLWDLQGGHADVPFWLAVWQELSLALKRSMEIDVESQVTSFCSQE